ncbi:Molecular chaperone (DnaJ superfamily) [Handroanthus impetiginosus]|uniref:Molecular chaperone (DnaJ superfamily) n=1 Tax=Handroanthus impetiginosus TaxID=429701 RepID=A0A2G9G2A1_9LAMI|nr:Molecular chaperone (DnaJ superfamily) [Handroanthus impetiginosus]
MAAISLSSLSFTPPRPRSSFLPLASSPSCFFAGRASLCDNGELLRVSLSSATQMNKTMSVRRFRRAGVVAAADYYSTLGVPESASSKEIRAAYTELVRQYHPDVKRERGTTQKFKEISAAYDVLSDDEKRALYDQYGEAGLKSGVDGASGYEGTIPVDILEDIFDSLGRCCWLSRMDGTGDGASLHSIDSRGENLLYHMTLEFSEVVTCEVCAGTGVKAGSKMRICSTCSGKGLIVKTEQTTFGMNSEGIICQNCGGVGEMIDSCHKCSGAGRIRVRKDIKVKIPPGVYKDSILPVRGQGDAGPRGGPPGDLCVYLHFNPRSTISISYLDAIMGTTVQVRTGEATTEVQILPGTQPGAVLTSIHCDHLFTIKVCIPANISEEERELLEELASFGSVPANCLRTRPRLQQRDASIESEKSSTAENTDESEDQNELWKKLTDFAGPVANRALKWFKDNF